MYAVPVLRILSEGICSQSHQLATYKGAWWPQHGKVQAPAVLSKEAVRVNKNVCVEMRYDCLISGISNGIVPELPPLDCEHCYCVVTNYLSIISIILGYTGLFFDRICWNQSKYEIVIMKDVVIKTSLGSIKLRHSLNHDWNVFSFM